MGNILTKAAENRSAVLSGITVLSVFAYLLYEAREKKEFRGKLIEAMKSHNNDF